MPTEERYESERRRIDMSGIRTLGLLRREWSDRGQWASWVAIGDELDLNARSVPRILGFGYRFGETLAAVCGGSEQESEKGGLLGAKLNLGVSLFDRICDTSPSLKNDLLQVVRPVPIDVMASAAGAGARQTRNRALGLILDLISSFLEGVMQSCPQWVVEESSQMLQRMYRSEIWVAENPLGSGGSCKVANSRMSEKSVLPMELTALLCAGLCGMTEGDPKTRQVVSLGRTGGTICWRIDDMMDVLDDWRTQSWNRVLCRVVERTGSVPDSIDDLTDCTDIASIIEGEAAALVEYLEDLQSAAEAARVVDPYFRCLQTTALSWTGGIHGFTARNATDIQTPEKWVRA